MKKKILIATLILLIGDVIFLVGTNLCEWENWKALSLSGMVVSTLIVVWCHYTWHWIAENEHCFWFWFGKEYPDERPWLRGEFLFIGTFWLSLVMFLKELNPSWDLLGPIVVGLIGWILSTVFLGMYMEYYYGKKEKDDLHKYDGFNEFDD